MIQRSILLLTVASLALSVFADPPTSESHWQAFPLDKSVSTPPATPFRMPDFDLNYHLPASQPSLVPAYLSVRPGASANAIQNWKSFNFNGTTVWNRPAIDDKTPHLVQDSTTGNLYYYRDSANTVNARLLDLDRTNHVLIDNRQKPAK